MVHHSIIVEECGNLRGEFPTHPLSLSPREPGLLAGTRMNGSDDWSGAESKLAQTPPDRFFLPVAPILGTDNPRSEGTGSEEAPGDVAASAAPVWHLKGLPREKGPSREKGPI